MKSVAIILSFLSISLFAGEIVITSQVCLLDGEVVLQEESLNNQKDYTSISGWNMTFDGTSFAESDGQRAVYESGECNSRNRTFNGQYFYTYYDNSNKELKCRIYKKCKAKKKFLGLF